MRGRTRVHIQSNLVNIESNQAKSLISLNPFINIIHVMRLLVPKSGKMPPPGSVFRRGVFV